MTAQSFDQAKANAFAETMIGVLDRDASALIPSIGHRTGLFNALAAIAEETSTNIIEPNPANKTYPLQPEDAACLRRVKTPNKTSAFSQYIPLPSAAEGKIVASFKDSGAAPDSSYKCFHQVMTWISGHAVAAATIGHSLPLTSRSPNYYYINRPKPVLS